MVVAGFELVPVEIAFVAAALALVLFRLLSLERGLWRDRMADPDPARLR